MNAPIAASTRKKQINPIHVFKDMSRISFKPSIDLESVDCDTSSSESDYDSSTPLSLPSLPSTLDTTETDDGITTNLQL